MEKTNTGENVKYARHQKTYTKNRNKVEKNAP